MRLATVGGDQLTRALGPIGAAGAGCLGAAAGRVFRLLGIDPVERTNEVGSLVSILRDYGAALLSSDSIPGDGLDGRVGLFAADGE